MKKIIACLDALHAYRLHLPVLYGVIALSFVRAGGISVNARAILVVGAFTCALVATYLLNRFTDRHQDLRAHSVEAVSSKKTRPFLVSTAIAAASGVALLLGGGFPLWVYGIYLAGGALYSVHFGRFQIRKILFLKNIYAASAWFSSFGIILWYLKPSFNPAWFARRCLYIFFLILVYEILWDIRDAKNDRQAGVATIPSVWGIQAGRAVTLCLIAITWVLCRAPLFSVLGFNMMLLAFFVVSIPANRPRLFHLPIYAQAGFSLASFLPR